MAGRCGLGQGRRWAVGWVGTAAIVVGTTLVAPAAAGAANIVGEYMPGATGVSLEGTGPSDTVPPETVPPASPTPAAVDDVAVTGGSTRTIVRIGAALFAFGAIATYIAAGSRRPRRDP